MDTATDIPFKTINDIPEYEGKVILVRAGLNVPIKDGKVVNMHRIEKALNTISYLKERGARVVVIAHIGRNPEETLKPVYEVMQGSLDVSWSDSLTGPSTVEQVKSLKNGEVLLLENTRSDDREVVNDDVLAKELASYADMYVNDAFTVSHREHVSLVGIPKYIPSYAGLQFLNEYTHLKKLDNPKDPSLFILGGAKFETKLPLIEKYSKRYSKVFVGGALANDILKARGFEVGKSLISDFDLSDTDLMKSDALVVPIDVVVQGPNGVNIKDVSEIEKTEIIVDAGPRTIEMVKEIVNTSSTVLWNGPLGNYETGFKEHTEQLARILADSDAEVTVGGGDTIASIDALNLNDKFHFVSSAGGAMLTFLEQGTLPGIEALKNLHEELS